jgi:predicted aspartyl protease
MRLNGFFKGTAPYILFSVRAEKPKILRQIPFLIDTGSDITGIAMKDCLAIGISFNSLGRPVGSISGIKDKARRWEIKGELRAITQETKLERFGPMKLFILETSGDCPSLLGRDFLEQFGFRLIYNIKRKELYLEE